MISVIIPTYNEKKYLESAIESLGDQSYEDFEIIVIDDGSTDGTLKILKNLKKTLPNFKFARQNHKGPGAARNYGAGLAKGNIFVFVDADMTFDPDFLKNLTLPIRKGRAKGTWSKEEYVQNWDNIWARCWNIEEGWQERRRHPKGYPDVQPVFRAILASEFKKVGGFTPGGYNDDWSLYEKLGYMAENTAGAVFYHKNPSSLSEIFGHAKWVGKRSYKMGKLGMILSLFRSSLPASLITGTVKALKNKTPAFIVFKVIYDFGIFSGILHLIFSGKMSK
jgi:glycosyltransferase involved in cell wall biosynthesis